MDYKTKKQLGSPQPLGVSPANDGTGLNFAIFSRHAEHVHLVLDFLDHQKGTSKNWYEIPLSSKNRTGDIWHIQIDGLPERFAYGYRIKGNNESHSLPHAFDPSKILIDPYCRIFTPRSWGEKSSFGERPHCMYVRESFDWQNVSSPKIPLTETVIYELHVRGFTQGAKAQVTSPGTFAALVEKIPYLQDLGITAIEILPVTAFDETDTNFTNPKTGEALRNFWGYNPLSFFALHSGYAAKPEHIITEFKTMVREFHRAGIEVYLDMVFNHTGEGNYNGKTSSFRGIDNSIYYILGDDHQYHNYSGCGNTLNCNHPIVRTMIYDALHYWVAEMRIDGFRFDLASIFSRGKQGQILPEAPVIEYLGEDPLLADVKLIAEAWDAAGLYQVGTFSQNHRWGEWNGRFRDDVRAFMAGHRGTVSKLATRIAGSSDLYQHGGKSPVNSINFITSHDGFTLFDLVSYNEKHNEENGENNCDGDNHNLSWNSGTEGKTTDSTIQALRLRRAKSFMLILLLSQGVPMFSAGDEMSRSQHGNNNAWCQDNSLSWLDWQLLARNKELYDFIRQLIRLRKRYRIFGRNEFFTDGQCSTISWQHLTPGEVNWSEECQELAFLLHSKEEQHIEESFFVMLNGGHQETLFTLPRAPEKKEWFVILESDANEKKQKKCKINTKMIIPSFGAALLHAQPCGKSYFS